ncbi:MAG: CBS domain-containing protein [Deltaproteobacteria bacterium]|nr:MAG: CBS domain-containing protein [Deltaproteobacteria bacterium]
MLIREIMTEEVETVSPEATAEEAFRLIYEGDFRHLPVVSAGNELLGILSERDLREQVLPALLEMELPEAREEAMARSVSELMQGDTLTVHPDDDVDQAIELMLEHRVGAVPVVHPDTGELMGIVSYVDVLRAARELF